MHRHQPALPGQRVGGAACGDEAGALDDDRRAQRLGTVDLGERGPLGHHDRCRNPQPACVVGDALRMVAGRHGDDSGAALVVVERQQLVERAALLE